MTLRKQLAALGGVGAPVKVGTETSWIYCGRLCQNYEAVFDALYKFENEYNTEVVNELTNHIENFEQYWQELIEQNMQQLEHDMDYPKCRMEYQQIIDDSNRRLTNIENEIESLHKQKNKAETSMDRAMFKARIHSKLLDMYDIKKKRNKYRDLLKEIANKKDLTEVEKDKMRYKRHLGLMDAKAEDWEKSNEKRDIYADELTHPAWLEREVYEVCNSIDPEEEEGTQNVSFSGVARRKYWYSKEQERDERMQALIAKYSGVENEKG